MLCIFKSFFLLSIYRLALNFFFCCTEYKFKAVETSSSWVNARTYCQNEYNGDLLQYDKRFLTVEGRKFVFFSITKRSYKISYFFHFMKNFLFVSLKYYLSSMS